MAEYKTIPEKELLSRIRAINQTATSKVIRKILEAVGERAREDVLHAEQLIVWAVNAQLSLSQMHPDWGEALIVEDVWTQLQTAQEWDEINPEMEYRMIVGEDVTDPEPNLNPWSEALAEVEKLSQEMWETPEDEDEILLEMLSALESRVYAEGAVSPDEYEEDETEE